MKKILFLTAALFLFNISNAQVSIIPKLGTSISNMYIKDKETESKVALSFGIAADVQLNSFFSIQPEVNYNSRGFSFYNSFFSDEKQTQHTNYLDVPLLAKVSFGRDKFKAYLNAGPYVGYWLYGGYRSGSYKTKQVFSDAPAHIYPGNETISTKVYNRLDYGVQLGGGLSIGAGRGRIIVDGRYAHGFADYMKDYSDYYETNGTVFMRRFGTKGGRHRNIYLTLGYALPLYK